MAFVPSPQADQDERRETLLGRERKLRVRSYVVLSTGLTSEMNKLGMHPTAPCPRRSLSPPQGEIAEQLLL